MTYLRLNALPDILKLSEAAAFLRVSSQTLIRWEKKGVIMPIRMGKRGDRMYKKESIINFINQKV